MLHTSNHLIFSHLSYLMCSVFYVLQCSIDGLLDRAVKHMLHLRSVTKHAEKLRQLAHHEVCEVFSYWCGRVFVFNVNYHYKH